MHFSVISICFICQFNLKSCYQFTTIIFYFNIYFYYIFIICCCYYFVFFITISVLFILVETFTVVFQWFIFSLQSKLSCISISVFVLVLFLFVSWIMFVVVTVCNYILKVHFWIIFSWLNIHVVLLLNLHCLLIIFHNYFHF